MWCFNQRLTHADLSPLKDLPRGWLLSFDRRLVVVDAGYREEQHYLVAQIPERLRKLSRHSPLETIMFQAHAIEVNGTFVGGALMLQGGFRFRAVHPMVDELDDCTWSSLAALRRGVEHYVTTGRLGSSDRPIINQ